MERVNVTISLPATMVCQAKQLAADRGLSLSGFLARILEEQVVAAQGYRQARERQRERMKKGIELGTNGAISWTPEMLHGR